MKDSPKRKGGKRSASVLLERKMLSLDTQKSLHDLWCNPLSEQKLITREQNLKEGLAQQRDVGRWKAWVCIVLF